MIASAVVGTPLEGEHLHPYTLGTVSEDKCHGKKQIHTRAKDPDRAGINQNQHKHGRTVPQAQRPPNRRFIAGNRDSWNLARQA